MMEQNQENEKEKVKQGEDNFNNFLFLSPSSEINPHKTCQKLA